MAPPAPTDRTTALLGGSFDPPHVCHVLISLYALQASRAREVWWVPCAQHAFGKASAPFEPRLRMCRAATRHLPAVSVVDVERERSGPSYTIDTVAELRAEDPGRELLWVVGSDLLDELPRWHRWPELREQITFLVIPRGEGPPAAAPQGARLERLPVAFPDISSTAVRRALAEGRTVEGWLDREVQAIVAREGLYRSS